MVLISHVDFYQVAPCLLVLLYDLTKDSVGVPDDIRMSDRSMQSLESAVVTHPVGDDLTQPTDSLGTKVELAGHVSSLACVLFIEATTATQIFGTLCF